jgi:hypothetical protein
MATTQKVFGSASKVIRSVADWLSSASVVERDLRSLSAVLADVAGEEDAPRVSRRAPATPRATTDFSDVDSVKAGARLASFGVRKAR